MMKLCYVFKMEIVIAKVMTWCYDKFSRWNWIGTVTSLMTQSILQKDNISEKNWQHDKGIQGETVVEGRNGGHGESWYNQFPCAATHAKPVKGLIRGMRSSREAHKKQLQL